MFTLNFQQINNNNILLQKNVNFFVKKGPGKNEK